MGGARYGRFGLDDDSPVWTSGLGAGSIPPTPGRLRVRLLAAALGALAGLVVLALPVALAVEPEPAPASANPVGVVGSVDATAVPTAVDLPSALESGEEGAGVSDREAFVASSRGLSAEGLSAEPPDQLAPPSDGGGTEGGSPGAEETAEATPPTAGRAALDLSLNLFGWPNSASSEDLVRPPARVAPAPGPTATPSATPVATPTPSDAPEPAPAQQPSPRPPTVREHAVAAGETLAILAERYGVTARTIARANQIQDADSLSVGRRLLIPASSGALHRVEPGESLSALADRYGVPPEEVAAANGLEQPDVIHPGDLLVIPEVPDAVLDKPEQPSARPAPRPEAPKTYVAVAGDTLGSVALRFEVPLETLLAGNGLDPARPLLVGQRLSIPPVGAVEHVVQRGETVTRIAAHYGASASEVIRANALAEPYILTVGQKLLVPGGAPPRSGSAPAIQPPTSTPTATPPTPTVAPPTPTPTPTATAAPPAVPTATPTAAAPAAPGSTSTYEVRPGDTLTRISLRFGVTVKALAAANGLDLTRPLAVGQRLTLPAAAAPGAPAPSPSPAPAQAAAPTVAPTATPTRTPSPTATPRPQPTQTPTPAKAPTQPPGGADTGARAVAAATKLLGSRYVWGGASPATGFDCSGLVMYVYRQVGAPVPRDLWGQMNSGARIPRDALRPGDLVFFQNTYKPGLSHDGIYVGGGQFVHAAGENSGVIVSKLDHPYWAARYLGATRPY